MSVSFSLRRQTGEVCQIKTHAESEGTRRQNHLQHAFAAPRRLIMPALRKPPSICLHRMPRCRLGLDFRKAFRNLSMICGRQMQEPGFHCLGGHSLKPLRLAKLKKMMREGKHSPLAPAFSMRTGPPVQSTTYRINMTDPGGGIVYIISLPASFGRPIPAGDTSTLLNSPVSPFVARSRV